MLESAMMGGLRGVEAHMAPNQRATRLRLFAPGGHLAKELAHNATGACFTQCRAFCRTALCLRLHVS